MPVGNYLKNNAELTSKIEQLFFSQDESNVALACELMKGGGMPDSIAQELSDPEAQLYFLVNHGLVHPFIYQEELDLSRLDLSSLPESLLQLQNIGFLNLFYNQFSQFPTIVCQLLSLKKLWVHHNQLTSIPENLGNLYQLEELVLSFNQLKTLPDSIGLLSNLQVLYLHHNQLTSLPTILKTLPRLRKITLWNNAFTVEEEVALTNDFASIELVF